jgi:hypothetical protein
MVVFIASLLPSPMEREFGRTIEMWYFIYRNYGIILRNILICGSYLLEEE